MDEHHSGDRRYDARHQRWCIVLYEIPSRVSKGRPSILVWLDGSPKQHAWTTAPDLSEIPEK
jgi:hypothetical protein